MAKKIRINKELNKNITAKIMAGQTKISWHFVRSYCNSNFKADEICHWLTNCKGINIEYQGKIYSSWEVVE